MATKDSSNAPIDTVEVSETTPSEFSDLEDPLRWSITKKHVSLAVICVAAWLADFGSSIGIPLILAQTKEWQTTPTMIQRNLSGNVAALGAGGLFAIPAASYFGRLPVMTGCLALGLGTAIWCAVAGSSESYIGARVLNGFFATVAQAGGLMWIQDMFPIGVHPQKINYLSSAIILAPYLGPLVGSFVVYGTSWRWCFWILTILSAVVLIMVILFLDESYYPRHAVEERKPLEKGTSAPHNALQPKSKIMRVLGVEQWRTGLMGHTVGDAIMRPCVALLKPPVILLTVYYFLNFGWIVGVNATVSIWLSTYYGFSSKNSGFFYFTGIVATLIGWLMGKLLYSRLRAPATHRPEVLLLPCYLAAIFQFVALVLTGFALQRHWHYMVIAVCFGLQIVGTLVVTVAVNSYLLRCYPEAPGEVGAWVNLGRCFGGFMATYVQIEWVTEVGPARALGSQGAIVMASLVIVVVVQVFGEKLRKAGGPIVFRK